MKPKFYDPAVHGITQGMLATWMACRQKARWFLQGYSLKTTTLALTYGEIGHAVLEMAYKDLSIPSPEKVKGYVAKVESLWRKEHPKADKKALEYLEMSLLIAEATLPLYFSYWAKDIKEIKWVQLEQEFKIPYTIQDGRTTFIRGKMDGVFNSGKKLWLFESKFKSRISEEDMVDTLPFEMQVGVYLWALQKLHKKIPSGVLYNVIRRAGLQQKSSETMPQFTQRCIDDIKSRPEFYFLRLEIAISEKDLECFTGELEDMIVDFLDWWEGKSGHYKCTAECINKYGRCNYLPLCASKRFELYTKREMVYRELEDL